MLKRFWPKPSRAAMTHRALFVPVNPTPPSRPPSLSKIYKSLLAAFIVLSLTPGAVVGQRFVGPVTAKRVRFVRGRTTVSIKGVAKTPGTYEYLLRVRAGQTMIVHLTSSNDGVEFSVETPTGEWADNALGVMDWSGVLKHSGDYKILLTNNRSRVQRNPRYTLEVTVR